MDEDDWLTASAPELMLRFRRCRASDRKLRLFAVACCRRHWARVTDHRSRAAVEMAEAFADGHADIAALDVTHRAAWDAEREAYESAVLAAGGENRVQQGLAPLAADDAAQGARAFQHAALVRTDFATATSLVASTAVATAIAAAGAAVHAAQPLPAAGYQKDSPLRVAARTAELAAQVELLRCISGNPFRPVVFEPSWRTEAARSLAQEMYSSRDFTPAPILADALEEAGCTDAAVLSHLRGGGTHVRGCWVVDGVLGRE